MNLFTMSVKYDGRDLSFLCSVADTTTTATRIFNVGTVVEDDDFSEVENRIVDEIQKFHPMIMAGRTTLDMVTEYFPRLHKSLEGQYME